MYRKLSSRHHGSQDVRSIVDGVFEKMLAMLCCCFEVILLYFTLVSKILFLSYKESFQSEQKKRPLKLSEVSIYDPKPFFNLAIQHFKQSLYSNNSFTLLYKIFSPSMIMKSFICVNGHSRHLEPLSRN